MLHLDEAGLTAYGASARRANPGKKPKRATTTLSASGPTCTGDVGGNTQAKDMGSVFKAGPASGAAFGGLRAFHKYGVGAGLTPASLKHKSDATTQNYWLRRLGLIRTHLGAELSQREESTKTAGADAAADHSATQQATASSAGKPMRRRSRRSSRIAIANCLSPKRGLSPRAGSAACSESDGGDVGVTAGNAVLASQVRRRHLMAQLTGEDIDARLMREVLMQAHRHVPRKQSSEHSDVGSFDWCRGSPSVGSSSSRRVDPLAGDGVSGVVSVSSRAHSEAGAGADAASLESGGGDSCASSWSFLSALQLEMEPLAGAPSGLVAPPAARSWSAEERERYRSVLLMSDGESADQ